MPNTMNDGSTLAKVKRRSSALSHHDFIFLIIIMCYMHVLENMCMFLLFFFNMSIFVL